MAGIGVRDRYRLRLGLPVENIVHDELQVKNRRRQMALE